MPNGAQQREGPSDTPCPGGEVWHRAHGLCDCVDVKCAEWEPANPQTGSGRWLPEAGERQGLELSGGMYGVSFRGWWEYPGLRWRRRPHSIVNTPTTYGWGEVAGPPGGVGRGGPYLIICGTVTLEFSSKAFIMSPLHRMLSTHCNQSGVPTSCPPGTGWGLNVQCPSDGGGKPCLVTSVAVYLTFLSLSVCHGRVSPWHKGWRLCGAHHRNFWFHRRAWRWEVDVTGEMAVFAVGVLGALRPGTGTHRQQVPTAHHPRPTLLTGSWRCTAGGRHRNAEWGAGDCAPFCMNTALQAVCKSEENAANPCPRPAVGCSGEAPCCWDGAV